MSSHKYSDKNIEFDIIEEGKRVIKEGYLPIHADFMTGELVIPKKVWLSVEEAKQANQCVMIEIANLINDFGPADLIHKLETLHQALKVKIEQAETKK